MAGTEDAIREPGRGRTGGPGQERRDRRATAELPARPSRPRRPGGGCARIRRRPAGGTRASCDGGGGRGDAEDWGARVAATAGGPPPGRRADRPVRRGELTSRAETRAARGAAPSAKPARAAPGRTAAAAKLADSAGAIGHGPGRPGGGRQRRRTCAARPDQAAARVAAEMLEANFCGWRRSCPPGASTARAVGPLRVAQATDGEVDPLSGGSDCRRPSATRRPAAPEGAETRDRGV